MTPKENRLTKETISSKLKFGRKIEGDLFKIVYVLQKNQEKPQISIVASKKTAPTAVMRNTLRRRAYSAVKPLISKVLLGSLVLIHYKKADTSVSLLAMTEEIEGLFRKVGLVQE